MTAALALASTVGAMLGVFAALRPGSVRDVVLTAAALVLNAMPGFWIGLMAIVLFAVKLSWFPLGGIETITGERSGIERSEEHTSELQSLMRISYAVFCLK